MPHVPAPDRRTQQRLRMIITVPQADREHRRIDAEMQAWRPSAVLQHDVAWLRREVAKHTSRLK
jgi:hypothetical protein